MFQKQYSLADFSLISTEEDISDVNGIFAVKKDPQAAIIEYYASIPNPNNYSSNKKLKDFFTYLAENRYIKGIVSYQTDKSTINSIYAIFYLSNINFIKSIVRANALNLLNTGLMNKSNILYLKFDLDLVPERVYYQIESDDDVIKADFITEIELYLSRSIIANITAISTITDSPSIIFTEKEGDETVYINKEIAW